MKLQKSRADRFVRCTKTCYLGLSEKKNLLPRLAVRRRMSGTVECEEIICRNFLVLGSPRCHQPQNGEHRTP